MHDRNIYTIAIEKDGVDENVAFNKSLIQIRRGDIKEIIKSSDCSAIIRFKSDELLKAIEDYDEVIDTIQKADLAVDIMHKEKVYIFDEFDVDDDELNVCESWNAIKDDI
jgi:hypothetical protein